MRGKRAKQYRKLMHQYALTFNFRVPYQVLVDAEMIQDAARFKMDLLGGLERTLQGKVKPMITYCSIRHLRAAADASKDPGLVALARQCEMRRCNHHELPEPLTTLECLSSVVDPKSSGTNKHRYVVASQDQAVRAAMQRIPGVPLVYIKRSVMIMEPMSEASAGLREREERGKFRAGLKGRREGGALAGRVEKRKREDEEHGEGDEIEVGADAGAEHEDGHDVMAVGDAQAAPAAKKRRKGPKGPNPLSVKKPKRRVEQDGAGAKRPANESAPPTVITAAPTPTIDATATEEATKKKRKRKHKTNTFGADADAV
ncbi:hypothetical protein W97_01269 [Coniosporium apollinis CBS 100218]|uniref:U three protein 23 n=1 Tax=Coniosporium apollinis (strain CBS 100218) TaxID=1168221 RepID=R7YJI0_CONA1|nr:uncharacterized protein W97_01269 [Coniosporium apollinis CBS 100218]EON62050.1 hypothetical protein W97_01269 [Coniosporium apollinis CBS 100218]